MRQRRLEALALLGSGLLSLNCARSVPAPYLPERGRVPGYEWPPRAVLVDNGGAAAPEPTPRGSYPHPSAQAKVEPPEPKLRPLPPEPMATPRPMDTRCLEQLRAVGVRFRTLEDLRGVQTPIDVRSPLGGVEYWSHGNGPLRVDCRFALALARVGPMLRDAGIRRIRFSGAYVYKTAPSGRLSHHAYGVAIDLHDFETAKGVLSVKNHFRQGAGCGRQVPTLNRAACELEAQGIFEELLTPDFNRAHRDHLHLSIPRS